MRWLIGIIVIIIIVLIGWITFFSTPGAGTNATSTATTTVQTATTTAPQTQSDGTITFTVPAGFGMASDPSQILVSAYIPPCSSDFEYCLYYTGTAYQNTNFEAAGLRIAKRTDLTTQTSCINTPPEGFDASTKPTKTNSASAYVTSQFKDIGDAGAGHVSQAQLYRLYAVQNATCYEFETRIGNTEFSNYPPGSIQEFTTADRTALQNELNGVLKGLTLGTSTVAFPGM